MRDSGVAAQGRDAMHAAMQARREKTADEIAALLTPEQQTTFSEMRARMKERLANGFGHGEMLTKELGLTPDQQEKVKAMMAARHTASQGVRTGLRSGNVNRTELRQRFRAEREAFHNELKAILTPDQQVLLQKRSTNGRAIFRRKSDVLTLRGRAGHEKSRRARPAGRCGRMKAVACPGDGGKEHRKVQLRAIRSCDGSLLK